MIEIRRGQLMSHQEHGLKMRTLTLGQQRQPKAILSILVVHWMVVLGEVVEEFHLLAVHDRILRGFDFFGQVFSSSISLVEFLDTVLLCYLPQSQIEENHDQVYLLQDIVQGLAEHFGVHAHSKEKRIPQ
jgi:hypothetical protein